MCKITSVLITLNAQKCFKCAKNRLFLGYFNFFFTFFVTFFIFLLYTSNNHRTFATANERWNSGSVVWHLLCGCYPCVAIYNGIFEMLDSLQPWTAWQPVARQPYTTGMNNIVQKIGRFAPRFFLSLLIVQICKANVFYLAVEVQG